ncbi:FAD-dependent oxidoreductase [Dyadobacter sp. LHD-138]|uniref:FAD-dependent oxidoreductase n=1 Tax=Dyadobacter sp. LHD-138 TaxID=3071413 RepID=UPI0027DF2CB0|nr:FAD-dependent oxidoreductase [Dyadobacter sp. LHD-138]MDQ6481693.1 FAD-dependent oxidoreductase [Dyadobacter sp. LHD-138]
MKLNLTYLISVFFFSLISCGANEKKEDFFQADVIVYGGTSAAVTAAVQVVKQGKTVLIVSPDTHLGGLSSGGLGFTDTGNKSVIGGLAREFYHRVYMYYDKSETWEWQKKDEYGNKGQGTPAMDGAERTMWIFEPRIAERVFEDFAKENNLKIYRDEWLDRENGVEKKDGRIVSIKTLSGKVFKGKMFIDATYEGDLMASAKVKYHVGREANSVYNEEWNGIQAGVFQHKHYFQKKISPYKIEGDPQSGLLPYVSGEKIGKNGEGDNKIQAYCFRMCLSSNPDNRIPFPKPEGYDRSKYELLARVYKAGWSETFEKYDPIPNKKTDTNNHGPFSTDFIGQNYDYPEATYERRKEIIKEHELYQKGLMYYLSNDEAVPAAVRAEMNKWGLPKDEFKDNGGWPHQLYIREARRMIGKEVMTENETLSKKAVSESVGMGSYSLDSHNAQRYVKEDGFVQNEGDIGVHAKVPYSISYGSLVPKKEDCENLLVPVCMSSSHIAFGSIRMEPVFMILGQSAASAAILAIDNKTSVQDVEYAKLREQLLKDNQRLEFKK